MLKARIITEINQRSEGDFTIEELFYHNQKEWSDFSVQERRGVGRWAYNRIKRGQWNRDGWIIEPLLNTNPQRYRKRRQNPILSIIGERIFLNGIPGIEQTTFGDLIKILDASGKWLEIVDKPK
jgi:hypothetical protein